MNTQKMLMAVATTAVGFAFGLWVFNKYFKGQAMVSQGTTPTMSTPTASSGSESGL
jgi:hypothetical protein